MDSRFVDIVNIVGPEAMDLVFPDLTDLSGPPIGPGLRSVVRIASGMIKYTSNTIGNPILNQVQTAIVDGAIERNDDERRTALLRTHAPIRLLQEFNESLGFDCFEMKSVDSHLSIDASKPTT